MERLRQGVPAIHEAEFKRLHPDAFALRRHMRGVFRGPTHWTDSVPCDLDAEPIMDITGQRALPREQLFGIRERLGCADVELLEIAVIGMNRFWRTSNKLRRLAAQYVRLAPSIHKHAKELWQAFTDDRIDVKTALPRADADTRPDSFVCIHYRQGDKLAVSPREYNYTAQLVVDILDANRFVLPGERVYVATDLPPDELDKLEPFFRTYDAKALQRHYAALVASWRAPANDYIGAVEVQFCSRARLFFGSSSTFSAAIVQERHGVTGIADWEIDATRNLRITRLTRDWKREHRL